ncbi:sodium-dependent glucose transporter 1A-like [Parasteatoda tepidariorum]|uniref:sodium-dependent glucose transporter 1A-like n=1 Tax=Parasteatoda tepidariorum TaxID=114398 RepID=UPI00077FA6E8|nr:sodium-dependent glucose transporter 1A-like [Parasteatoda tepidariorum]
MKKEKSVPLDRESVSVISSISSRRSIEEEQKGRRVLLTVLITSSYLCLGFFKAIPGPTLYILKRLAGVKMEGLMLIFSARSLGYISGYVVGGAVFDNTENNLLNRLIIFIVEIICAATAFAVPFCHGIVALTAAFFGAGISISILETGFNTFVLHMWGRKSNPYFMALHFLNGIGGLLGIVLQRAFVQDISAANATANITLYLKPEDIGKPIFPHLMYSYIVLCLIICCIALFWLISLFCPCNQMPLKPFQLEADIKVPSKEFTMFAVLTSSLLAFLCGTISLGYVHMFTTFAIEEYNISTKTSLDLASFFWGFFAVGGFFAVFASRIFHPFFMIIACLILEIISGVVLITLSKSNNDMLIVGNVLLGLGAAALLGWSILWMDRYIVTTYKIISALLMAHCLAEMIIPPILAYALTKSTNSLSYFVLYMPVIYLIVFALQCFWFFPHGEKFVSISKLPKKIRKHRWFPIFLESWTKGSDPQLIATAMKQSGIDLERPVMVTKRESPAQTEEFFWRPKTRDSGIQVQYLTREETRASLQVAKEALKRAKQVRLEEELEEEKKESKPVSILGGIFGKTEKEADKDDEKEEKEKPEQKKHLFGGIFGKKSEEEDDKSKEKPAGKKDDDGKGSSSEPRRQSSWYWLNSMH